MHSEGAGGEVCQIGTWKMQKATHSVGIFRLHLQSQTCRRQYNIQIKVARAVRQEGGGTHPVCPT
jgi:hypothetical protein